MLDTMYLRTISCLQNTYKYEQEYGIWTFGFFWYPNG